MLEASTSPLSYNVIGALMEVHRELGPGFLESAYQEALAQELASRNVPFCREARLQISYKGHPLQTRYRADFICDSCLLVELKAQSELGPVDDAQVIHYLKATRIPVGILANFGETTLRWRRFVGPAFDGQFV